MWADARIDASWDFAAADFCARSDCGSSELFGAASVAWFESFSRIFAARPREQSAVGICGIARGEKNCFGLGWFHAQAAQHVDGGRGGELRGAHSGDEHAAADDAAFFQSFQSGINCVVAARNIFGDGGFAHDDAVARKELLRDVGAPLRDADGLRLMRGDERPAAVRGTADGFARAKLAEIFGRAWRALGDFAAMFAILFGIAGA